MERIFSAAKAEKCDVQFNRKVAEAYYFSRFLIEQSNNGAFYQQIAVMKYKEAQPAYAFRNKDPGLGKWYYRLSPATAPCS